MAHLPKLSHGSTTTHNIVNLVMITTKILSKKCRKTLLSFNKMWKFERAFLVPKIETVATALFRGNEFVLM